MEWIVLLALLVLTWFFAENGMQFFSALVLILAVLYAAVSMAATRPATTPSKPPAPAAANQPVIIHTGSQESIPSEMKIKVKPNWKANDPWETVSNDIGGILNGVGRTIAWVFRGFKKP